MLSRLYSRKKLWFGHTRLAILDLSEAGAQPMMSQDGRWVTVLTERFTTIWIYEVN